MKVYVDEKDSGTTVTFKEENGKRQYLYVHDKEGFIFKSLTDHDKQVRKEVCEKIREIADIDDWEEINGYTLEKILNQIQGGLDESSN